MNLFMKGFTGVAKEGAVMIATLEDWQLLAKCRGLNDALFPEGKDQKRAKAICSGCPVRMECLAEALDNRIVWGFWGGLTERARRQVLRARPDIKSWSKVLQAAVDAQQGGVRVIDRRFDRPDGSSYIETHVAVIGEESESTSVKSITE